MSSVLLVQGTALALPLRDASVHCVVTSPPYYGLRDYGTGTWQGGEAACTHAVRLPATRTKQLASTTLGGGKATVGHAQEGYAGGCPRCGATRVDQQLGLEESVEAYLAAMVQVFREVWRVLRPEGTCWVNIGDAMRDKQLQGIPWRLAFAMQADGWILRADIIWDKPSCMPESVQDRPTRSHEYVFLFSKQAHYHYDAEAIKEASVMSIQPSPQPSGTYSAASGRYDHGIHWSGGYVTGATRNARTVWRIASEPFSGSHFATFPPALVRRCLLAGAPSQVCRQCGAPYQRPRERTEQIAHHNGSRFDVGKSAHHGHAQNGVRYVSTAGEPQPTCACAAGTKPATVLDPFCGSGTTILVARELGHHAIGVDLSLAYLHDIARERLSLAALAAWQHGQAAPAVSYGDLPLFGGS
jgi:DNA modification methylase